MIELNNHLKESEEQLKACSWEQIFAAGFYPDQCNKHFWADPQCSIMQQVDHLDFNRTIINNTPDNKLFRRITHFFDMQHIPRMQLECDEMQIDANARILLREHNFHPTGKLNRYLLDSSGMTPETEHPFTLERVSYEDAHLFAETLVNSYGYSDLLIPFFASLCRKPEFINLIARHRGTVVAAISLIRQESSAEILWSGTIPEMRGLGAFQQLLWKIITLTDKYGIEVLWAEIPEVHEYDSNMIRDLLAQFNFKLISSRNIYLRYHWDVIPYLT
jgi:hypothetical protein